MAIPDRVALVGYRGSGKSSVGRELAKMLGYAFVDSDALIEQQQGKTIREMFAEEGEGAFRAAEERVIRSLCERERVVLSLGGGAVLSAATRDLLRQTCRVVYLDAPADVLAKRLAVDPASADQRPALTDAGLCDEIDDVLAHRRPLYEEVADHRVDTAHRSVPELAEEIARLLSAPRAL